MSRMVTVFSGYNQRAVVAFLRTLVKNGVDFAIIASAGDDPIFLSSYAKQVLAIRRKKELEVTDLLDCLEAVKKKTATESCFIAPSTEALNRFLIDNRDQFESHSHIIPLVGKSLYQAISDKEPFAQLCQKHSILVPVSYQDLDQADLPMVAKPRKYFSETGKVYTPVLILDQAQLERFRSDYDAKDFYYQTYIPGTSYYLLYYFYEDGGVEKSSQKNYIQQPGGKSIVAADIADFHTTEESAKYESLFKNLGYHGLVMVEVKNYKGQNYMIEANPRFWGPSQLFVDAGVNLFEVFLYDWHIIKEKPKLSSGHQAKYFWLGGYLQALDSKQGATYYDYSAERYESDKTEWLAADIYNRDDTRNIFESEVKRYQ